MDCHLYKLLILSSFRRSLLEDCASAATCHYEDSSYAKPNPKSLETSKRPFQSLKSSIQILFEVQCLAGRCLSSWFSWPGVTSSPWLTDARINTKKCEKISSRLAFFFQRHLVQSINCCVLSKVLSSQAILHTDVTKHNEMVKDQRDGGSSCAQNRSRMGNLTVLGSCVVVFFFLFGVLVLFIFRRLQTTTLFATIPRVLKVGSTPKRSQSVLARFGSGLWNLGKAAHALLHGSVKPGDGIHGAYRNSATLQKCMES